MSLCIDDLTVNARRVLLYVLDHPQATEKDISDHLALSRLDVSEALLEALALVERLIAPRRLRRSHQGLLTAVSGPTV